jgi:hypothetical protein
MKVSRNGRIFRKNGPFVTLGQNVTAKFDEKYTDKMSQTLGQNVTVRRFVTMTNRPNLLGWNVTIWGGWTIHPL